MTNVAINAVLDRIDTIRLKIIPAYRIAETIKTLLQSYLFSADNYAECLCTTTSKRFSHLMNALGDSVDGDIKVGVTLCPVLDLAHLMD